MKMRSTTAGQPCEDRKDNKRKPGPSFAIVPAFGDSGKRARTELVPQDRLRLDVRPPQTDPQVVAVRGEPSINMPLEGVTSEDDRRVLRAIDANFSSVLDVGQDDMFPVDSSGNRFQRKIFQKRLTVRPAYYVMGYAWRYDPEFYLSVNSLYEFQRRHLAIYDVRLNPSGGCCSKESNEVVGIATPCYCDSCACEYYETEDKSAPPKCPEGSWGRLIIIVNKNASLSKAAVSNSAAVAVLEYARAREDVPSSGLL